MRRGPRDPDLILASGPLCPTCPLAAFSGVGYHSLMRNVTRMYIAKFTSSLTMPAKFVVGCGRFGMKVFDVFGIIGVLPFLR